MTRILVLTNWYPPHHRGGYEINCQDVATRMAARGHQVEVLCGDERFPGVSDGTPTVPVRRDLRLYWRDEAPWRPPIRTRIEIERTNQKALVKALDELQPHVVSAWHMAALSLNLLTTIARRRIPIVYAICDSWPSYALKMDPWSRMFSAGPLTKAVGKLVERGYDLPTVLPNIGALGHASFVSEFTRQGVLASSRWAFPHSDVVPSGIDRRSLEEPDGPAPSRESQWKWRLVYLGRFDARKGTDTLIKALPLLPHETTLSMYGRGGETERDRLKHLARGLGLEDRVRFGALDRQQIGRAYRAADCLVFPSEWPEPFGLVPLEAMECGTPVVATGVGGSAEFLEDRSNCLLFPVGDPAALAAAVRQLAEDRELRSQLVAAGRDTARRYDVEFMADAYEARFKQAEEAFVGVT